MNVSDLRSLFGLKRADPIEEYKRMRELHLEQHPNRQNRSTYRRVWTVPEQDPYAAYNRSREALGRMYREAPPFEETPPNEAPPFKGILPKYKHNKHEKYVSRWDAIEPIEGYDYITIPPDPIKNRWTELDFVTDED